MKDGHIVQPQSDRGSYDFASAAAVLDAGIVCHVGLVQDGEPAVIPMLYARDGERLIEDPHE